MSSLTEITLQLIYKKLEEILAAIKRQEKSITQEQFNAAMKEVIDLINKKKSWTMWLLLLIVLNYGDTNVPYPHVEDVHILGIFATKAKCHLRVREVKRKALKQSTPIPKNKEMGCVSLNGEET